MGRLLRAHADAAPRHGESFNLCFNSPGFAVFVGGVITGPIGMAAGAIGDALVGRSRVVFNRGSGNTVRIAVTPTLARDGAGVRVAIVF